MENAKEEKGVKEDNESNIRSILVNKNLLINLLLSSPHAPTHTLGSQKNLEKEK